MKFHIVGSNETISEILSAYDMTFEELKKENKHIRRWDNLIPGTKLKIPVITESMNEEINSTEPFIEDYYPKMRIDEEEYEPLNEEISKEETIQEEVNVQEPIIQEVNNEEVIKETFEEKEQEMENKIKEKPNMNRVYIPYNIYPMYSYSPIIYVIPRPKQK